MNASAKKAIGAIFLAVSLGMILTAIILFVISAVLTNKDKDRETITVDSTIVDMHEKEDSDMIVPTVEYEVDGKQYRIDLDWNTLDMQVGNSYQLEVFVDNPTEAKIPEFVNWILTFIGGTLGVLGTVLFLIGVGIMISARRR